MPEPPPPTAVSGISINNDAVISRHLEITDYLANLADNPKSAIFLSEITDYLANLADNPKSAIFLSEITDYLANLWLSTVIILQTYWKSHYKARIIGPVDLLSSKIRNEVKQKVLTVTTEGIVEQEIAYLAPVSIGQIIDLPFPIDGDSWIDAESNILYLKANGKTIGSDSSGSDFPRNDLKELFLRYHLNPALQILSSTGQATVRSSPESDWQANKRLALPTIAGDTKLIFSGVKG